MYNNVVGLRTLHWGDEIKENVRSAMRMQKRGRTFCNKKYTEFDKLHINTINSSDE